MMQSVYMLLVAVSCVCEHVIAALHVLTLLAALLVWRSSCCCAMTQSPVASASASASRYPASRLEPQDEDGLTDTDTPAQ